MARSFPPDVFFCDYESLLFARFSRGRGALRLANARRYSISPGAFTPGMLTPTLVDPQSITDTITRIRREQGRVDKASLLLPDTWFRITVFDLPSLPTRSAEADEVVRWSMRKSLPVKPEEFRMAHQIVRHSGGGATALVAAIMDKTVVSLEAAFSAAGVDLAMIEPAGLNLWNAISSKQPASTYDRVLFYLRDRDFTSALFRGGAPLFVRSRTVGEERSLQQEIRLSASYFRSNLRSERVECCYIASESTNGEFAALVQDEFEAPAKRVSAAEHIDLGGAVDIRGFEPELVACAGVFTS